MFGTIMRARVRSDRREDFVRWIAGYEQRRRPVGFDSTLVAWEDGDPNRVVAIVRFTDKESYRANAADPATDHEYRAMLEYLEGEPEWLDVGFAD